MALRDLALTIFLVGGLPIALRRPFIGALLFAFIGLANPHRFTWGFAYSMPWALAYAVVTIAGLIGTQERRIGDSVREYLPMILYLAWMGVTTVFALERTSALPVLDSVAKVHLMCLVTLCLLTDWTRIRQLVWLVVCSVGFFGLKGGVFTILTGGNFLVWGPPSSAIEDNNHLAVGLVMVLPLMYWLYTDTQRRWLRLFILFAALMTAVSVFGSHSRSAFLGIIAMSAFLVLKSRHRVTIALVTVISAVAVVSFMPQDYWKRMETISNYEQDPSAMGRINTWHAAFNIANDRITGAGFDYYKPKAFARYAPNPNDIHSSHSIYFQALGEHGWIGLALFLYFWVYAWFKCRRVIKHAANDEETRSRTLLARMIQVSLIGFAVGGAFVNIGNWDMTYYLAISAIAMARITQEQARSASAEERSIASRSVPFRHAAASHLARHSNP
jgi:probable O-glycosylation ligase (exosortase A-associated)